jgi:hypothetical protein
MDISKVQFIKDLLSQKKIDFKTKERIISLATNEFSDGSKEIEKIWNEIEKLKGNRNTDSENKNSTVQKPKKNEDIQKWIDPSLLSKFLIEYNKDSILKYTCHTIDDTDVIDEINTLCNTSKYNFVSHQKLIESRYEKFMNEHKAHHNIKNLILTYIRGASFKNNNTNWSSDNIKINWKSPELISWSEINVNQVPNPGINFISKYKNKGFELPEPFNTNLTNKRIRSFSEIVIHFKNLFHIRGDNTLKSLLLVANQNQKWDERINFIEMNNNEFDENLELFTDVNKLIHAYDKIISLILEIQERFNQDKPIVKLMFKETGDTIVFKVHHQNTLYKKSLNDVISNKRPGDWFTRFVKTINGLCDFSIKANFDNVYFAEVNLWDGNPREARRLENFNGVEYILRFKK